jgi:hypothetical protein
LGFIPIPLSNVVPTLVIALISLAYLEEDGALLSIALLAAIIVLTVATAAIWEMFVGAKWISPFGNLSRRRSATLALNALSHLGQKRRFGDVRATSALPPKTDIHREGRHVSKVPEGHCIGFGAFASPSCTFVVYDPMSRIR